MGEQAKSRLALWASQLNAQRQKAGIFTDISAPNTSAQERTSLLDSRAGAEEEVSFTGGGSDRPRDYEMRSMDGGSKKDK